VSAASSRQPADRRTRPWRDATLARATRSPPVRIPERSANDRHAPPTGRVRSLLT
jgi:hypothetical protein